MLTDGGEVKCRAVLRACILQYSNVIDGKPWGVRGICAEQLVPVTVADAKAA